MYDVKIIVTMTVQIEKKLTKEEATALAFESLDADGSGVLDFEEVAKGLEKAGYPPNYAYTVFADIDKDSSFTITVDEFNDWVSHRYDDLHTLFQSIDKDKSGFLDIKELETFCFQIDIPRKSAPALMKQLDVNNDGQISFQEFMAGFALIRPSDFSTMKDNFLDFADADLAGVSGIVPSNTGAREAEKVGAVPAWTSAMAGAIGNVLTRIVIAPLERTRVQMIADAGKYPSMAACVRGIVANEGIAGLWAGTVLNVVRIGPQMGIAFFTKDYFKAAFAGEGNKPTALQTLAASMCSGVTCQTGIYPIDTIRTRMMTSPGTYTGFMDCLKTTLKNEGGGGLFKGLLPANMFAIPYYGTQFFVYDTLKLQYTTFRRPIGEPRPAHPLLGIPLGAISSCAACAVAFPFQMAWKRMQVQGVGGRPILYKNSFDCLYKVASTEGLKGVYAGLPANLVKLAPTGAISFMAVEAIKDAFGWRPGQYKA